MELIVACGAVAALLLVASFLEDALGTVPRPGPGPDAALRAAASTRATAALRCDHAA